YKETQNKILEQKIQFKKDELANLTEEIATKQEEINVLEQKLSTFSKKPEGLYLYKRVFNQLVKKTLLAKK
ncbi:hypothetical protein ACPTJF_24300, partial [Enterococcus faecalis]